MENTKTRKSLSILLALIMTLSALSMLTVTTFAETSGDYEYAVLDDGTAEITKYTGSATELIIPSTLDGYSVTSIGYNAFFKCTSLKTVIIPNSLISIGSSGFNACKSLTSITIPDSVTSIETGAFYNCTSLTSITIPDSVTSIAFSTFDGCKSLSNINLPDGIISIGKWAFDGTEYYNNENNWENGALYIDKYLIKAKTYRTTGNASVIGDDYTVKDGTILIATDAFSYCESLKKVVMPNTVERIGAAAFYCCDDLVSIVLSNNLKSIGVDAFTACKSLESISIPDSVTSIGWGAFDGCTSLTSITIPASVTSIGDYALGYYYSDTVDSYKVIDGFMIYGYTGSVAETYANENGIKFVSLDEPEPIAYPDVKDSAWYNEAAYYNAERGWITGYKNGNFGGGDQLKRQDFVVILARIAGADLTPYESVQNTMPDVVKGQYYAAAVNWAVANGIINGYQNGKFGVGDPITREQVCVILYRYMGSPAVTGADNTLKPFTTDAGKISSFAKNAVVWAIQNGVISGKNATTLAPTATASRAEIATIVMRMDQKGMFSA